jgi:transposase
MPKYVHITARLSPDELEQRYRQADDPVERSHLQIIWLLACGKRVREVAVVTGYCTNWIRIPARRYNQQGSEALADQRQHNSGAPSLLTGLHQQLQQVASRKLLLMAACGLAPKSLDGWASSSDARSILNGAGSLSSGWASRSRFLVLVITRPIQPSKKPLSEPCQSSEPYPASPSSCAGGLVGDG